MDNYTEYIKHLSNEIDYLINDSGNIQFEDFMDNERIKRAFIRSIEDINKSIHKIPEEIRTAHTEIEWNKITDNIEKSLNDYININYKVIWNIIKKYIPVLKQVIPKIAGEKKESKGKKYVIVEADSIEECLNMVSKKYKTPRERFDYKVIRKGSKGIIGVGSTQYKLKVFHKKKARPVPEKDGDEITVKDENRNGYFNIDMSEGKVLLSVYPPEGKGAPISSALVEQRLNELRISEYDESKINSAVNNMAGEPVEISEYNVTEKESGKCEVKISEDGTECYIQITPAELGGKKVTLEDVLEKLKAYNITENILTEDIENAIKEEQYNTDIPAARGKLPEKGKNAVIEYCVTFQHEMERSFTESDDGRLDYRDMGAIETINENTLLAVLKEPPGKGIPGKTVDGRIIEAEDGDVIGFEAGDNTELSDDGTKIKSTITGLPVLNDGILSVDNVYVVKGNVNMETGNIVFDGSIMIEGRVEDDFKVSATKDIVVNGSVGKAILTAEGDINIKSGIAGKGEAEIKAGKNIYANFIENANIHAGKGLYVKEAIMHCNITAETEIIMNGKRGLIVGGEVKAGKSIDIKELGAIGSKGIEIKAGINFDYDRHINEINEQYNDMEKKLTQVNTAVKLLGQKKKKEELDEKSENKFRQLLKALSQLKKGLESLANKKEQIKKDFRPYSDAVIKVQNKVHKGIRINICNHIQRVRDDMKFVKFYLENNEVRSTSYS